MRVNIEKTKQYYDSLEYQLLCECNYCKNYYSQVKAEYPKVASYLDSLGIDIEKPFEVSPLEPNENNILEYCTCQYIVFGSCPDTYSYQIDDVEFRVAESYPNTGRKEEHFVLEFYPIKLKMIVPL